MNDRPTDPATLIFAPTVYLVGRQQTDDDAIARFLSDHDVSSWSTDTDDAGEKLVEIAGRLCYMSFAKPRPGGNKSYLDHIREVGHGSVFEHTVYNLIVTGVSRSFTHEMVRHRAGWGYSQLSQRFVDESECSFVVPPLIDRYRAEIGGQVDERCWATTEAVYKLDAEIWTAWKRAMDDCQRHYAIMSELLQKRIAIDPVFRSADPTTRRKSAREAARSVLPNATETKIFMTGNARALRHFIEMRASAGADAEIRRVAVAVLRLLQAESMNLFGDYSIVKLDDGSEAAATEYPKV